MRTHAPFAGPCFGAAALAILAFGGCAPEPSARARLGEPPAGAVRGELAEYVDTRGDGTSLEQYVLRRGGTAADDVRLVFDVDPDLAAGALLDVWGAREGDALRVRRFEVVHAPVAEVSQALLNGAPFAPRSFVMAL